MGNELSTASSDFHPGDIIRVNSDLQTFKDLQSGHGEFVPPMEKILGEEGIVLNVNPFGNLYVFFGSQGWVVNPASCTLVSRRTDRSRQQQSSFQVGDKVRCHVEKAEFEKLQKFHGGWNPKMADIIGKEGTVLKVDDDGDIVVNFRYRKWFLNPASCTLVSRESNSSQQQSSFQVGDKVRCDVERAELEKLQEFHGGWDQGMTNILGKEGTVLEVDDDGDLLVHFRYWKCLLNPKSCSLVSKKSGGLLHNALLFKVGDKVRCDVEREEFEKLQEFHGGWNPMMTYVIGKEGVVIGNNGDGNVVVDFDDVVLSINALCCKQITPADERKPSYETSASGGLSASTSDDFEFKQQLETLRKRVEELELGNLCPDCKKRPKSLVFQCGHRTCTQCGATLDMCPVCRTAIKKKIKLV